MKMCCYLQKTKGGGVYTAVMNNQMALKNSPKIVYPPNEVMTASVFVRVKAYAPTPQ